jgi:two-component sensor histidine kinase
MNSLDSELKATHLSDLAEIESLYDRLRQTNEALVISVVRQHELTETAELLNVRLHRAMREAHHRIKNNLQVVAALVELQMDEAGPSADLEHLKRIRQHVRALASVHDLLTNQVQNDVESSSLSTKAMLERLIPMLQETSGGRHITADIADIALSTEKATALSLLVSECVSNAIKHSWGTVDITLHVEGAQASLEVCDNGKGFAPDFDPKKAAHTGLSLIDSTARHDLRGEVRYDNHPGGGGRVTVRFPIQP